MTDYLEREKAERKRVVTVADVLRWKRESDAKKTGPKKEDNNNNPAIPEAPLQQEKKMTLKELIEQLNKDASVEEDNTENVEVGDSELANELLPEDPKVIELGPPAMEPVTEQTFRVDDEAESNRIMEERILQRQKQIEAIQNLRNDYLANEKVVEAEERKINFYNVLTGTLFRRAWSDAKSWFKKITQ